MMRTGTSGEPADHDIIIVGSGLGGAVLAHRLAMAGLNVLIIEKGDWHVPAPGLDNEYVYDLHKPGADIFTVGGRSRFYGGALYRYRQIDFDEIAFEAGVSPAWPVSYDALEPYYLEAETRFKVHGAAKGDPSDPWRSGAYPYPPLPHDPIVAKAVDRLHRAGVETTSVPRGLDFDYQGACTMCARCDGFLCRRDAKMDAFTAALKPALATGRVKLMSRTDCLSVETDQTGQRVTGIKVSRDGDVSFIGCDRVAVCAGAPHSAALLRRSTGSGHSAGIGNHSGLLGRMVGGHSVGAIFPVVSLTPIGERHTKTFAINTFYEGDGDWPHPLGIAQVAGQTPFWQGSGRLKRPLIKAVADRSLLVFHMTEATPDRETGWDLSEDGIGALTQPRHQDKTFRRLRSKTIKAFQKAGYPVLTPPRPTEFWHLTGSAIMGTRPEESVVDPTGQVHGVDGLYVADASVLPSAAAVNTGLTIAALAMRTADAMLGRVEVGAPLTNRREMAAE